MISATTVAQRPTHSQVSPADRALLADQLQRLRVRLEGRAPVALLDTAACDTVPSEHCGYDDNAIPEPDPRQMTMEAV